ncbi:MAG: hypothetical protein M1835_007471 [Candelina submexicana]|nr:MAG: hypothetical protein M1835_007471 [Candelina submexicana]
MAAIERALPPELLLDIFGRLATKDVKSSRLACKRFNQFSSSHLLDKTYFALRPKTLEVFIDITRHPVFSRCIKELIFDASYFDESLTRLDKYERAILSMARHPPTQVINCSLGCENDPSNASARIPLKFREYCSLFAAQERMKARDGYRHDLQQGLMNLPNLRSIIFSDWRTIARWIERMSSAWDNKSTIGPASWYLQKGPMSWDVKNALWPTDVRDAMQDRAVFLDLDNSVIPFRNLLRAVSDTGVQIRKAGCFSDAENAVDIRPQALPPCVGGWGLLEKIGPHLDTIEMAFYIKFENSEPSRLVQRLEGLMQAASNLSSVSLRFRGGAHLITSITVLDNALSSY